MGERGLVVVTGASGFVAKWLVLHLLQAGYRVRGTVRSRARADQVRAAAEQRLGDAVAGRLDLVEADLMGDGGWEAAMTGATALCHTAAVLPGLKSHRPEEVIAPALEGTRRVLLFAHGAGISRVVYTSSIAAVGYGHGPVAGRVVYDETSISNPEALRSPWTYCVAKSRAERAAWDLAKSHGLKLTVILPGVILGPVLDREPGVSPWLVGKMLNGSAPALARWGGAIIDVRDVAALHVAALETPGAIGERYLATGRYMTLLEIADLLRAAYPGRRVPRLVVPDWTVRLAALFSSTVHQIVNDLGHEKHYDGRKGEALLGRSFIDGRDAVLACAESMFRTGLVR